MNKTKLKTLTVNLLLNQETIPNNNHTQKKFLHKPRLKQAAAASKHQSCY